VSELLDWVADVMVDRPILFYAGAMVVVLLLCGVVTLLTGSPAALISGPVSFGVTILVMKAISS
jgi:hypothetical protein